MINLNELGLDRPRILVIDDNPTVREDLHKILVGTPNLPKQTLSDLEDKNISDRKFEAENLFVDFPSYDLEFASQGQEGLELVKKSIDLGKPFSLMFVDIRMPPGWDGIETIQHIWKVDPWIQAVICTAHSDYSWSNLKKFLGTKDNLILLKKPFDVVEVRELATVLTKKWQLNNEEKRHIENLEDAVKERTVNLERNLTLVRATLESTSDGILIVNTEGEIIDYNKKFLDMWNIPSSILKAGLMKDLLSFVAKELEDPDAFYAKIDYLNKNFESESIDEMSFKNGRYFERYSKPYQIQDKIVGRVWSFRDITETRKLQDALLYHATHDKLTRLPNRRLLNDRIKQNMALAKRNNKLAAVLLFDLDKFKTINDKLGHTAGDFALKLIASRVTEVLRESDTLARLGGDEFVVAFSGVENEAQIEIIVNKILDVIKKPFKVNNYDFSLTVSMGISIYPKDGTSADDLLQKADGAMCRVKKQGKNNFTFCKTDESLRTLQLVSLENDLKKAIEKDELVLHYQPLIDLSSGVVVGVEALIRWNHPTLGLLMPNAFLNVAEESGLILPIGEWVLKNACAQNKAWQDAKLSPFKIAVNISSSQIKLPKFDELISNILKETRLEPQYLELELTESVIIENPELMLEVLNKIKKLGVDLVMDDFGTGYSSLNYLKRFPFNKLKLDKSLVDNINANKDDDSLVQSMILMAGNLNLTVIAEGVETKEQFAFLEQINCDQVQGYFLSKPIDAEGLTKLLRNHPNFPKS